jgi:hypothetical protein
MILFKIKGAFSELGLHNLVTQLAKPGLSHGKKGMRGMKNSSVLIATARRIQAVLRRIFLLRCVVVN